MDPSAPIGVFDSGIGGLTVLRALLRLLPGEDFVYLGDTARVPYGTKSATTVRHYSKNNLQFLQSQQVKLVVVACNTASAYALPYLQEQSELPIIGVVEPGARAASQASRNHHIGVIGTRGTVKSRAYEQALHAVDPQAVVVGWPCPLLVPLADEGFTQGAIPEAVVQHYLEGLVIRDPGIDTLLLACTHYPLLYELLNSQANALFEARVATVDSASAVAEQVQASLDIMGGGSGKNDGGQVAYFVTDLTRFETIGERFLGQPVRGVQQVDIS